MKIAPLLCLGTPLGNWHGLARAIQSGHGSTDQAGFEAWIRSTLGVQAAPSSEEDACLKILSGAPIPSNSSAPELSSECGVLFSSLACWLVDLLLERLPHVRILAFYESPAHMLARRLDVEAPADPDQILAVWAAATAKILAALRRHRNRVYLLSADECSNSPQAFESWLHQTLSFSLNGGAPYEAAPVDPLLLGLAETICCSSLKLLPLVQECEASLHPLGASDHSSLGGPGSEIAREALAAALLIKREGAQTRAELAVLQAHVAALSGEIHSAKERSRALENELADTRQNAAQEREKALGIHETLLLEVHNAHKESEDFFERWKKAETLHGQVALLSGELDSAKERSRAIENELADTRKSFSLDHEKALGIHEMLLVEIHNAHKESEDFYERWKKAETLHGQLSLTAGAVVRGNIHEDADHRHFEFALKDAELFGRQWPRLDFRLLVHRGNAGIALFLPPNSPAAPLYAWEPAGTENGVPYVLFVPSDAKAKRALVAATTHDLLLLKDAVSLIAADLRYQGAPSNSKTDWALTASRFLAELDDIPERLHYDAVQTKVDPSAAGGVKLHFNVVRAFFRGTLHPSLEFAWTPSAAGGGTLILNQTSENPPALHHWPLAPDGALAAELRIDFGNASSLKAKRKLWSHFSSAEKAFLRILIAEIPNLVFHLLRQHPKEALDKELLNRHARAMLGELRQFGRRPSPLKRLRMALSK